MAASNFPVQTIAVATNVTNGLGQPYSSVIVLAGNDGVMLLRVTLPNGERIEIHVGRRVFVHFNYRVLGFPNVNDQEVAPRTMLKFGSPVELLAFHRQIKGFIGSIDNPNCFPWYLLARYRQLPSVQEPYLEDVDFYNRTTPIMYDHTDNGTRHRPFLRDIQDLQVFLQHLEYRLSCVNSGCRQCTVECHFGSRYRTYQEVNNLEIISFLKVASNNDVGLAGLIPCLEFPFEEPRFVSTIQKMNMRSPHYIPKAGDYLINSLLAKHTEETQSFRDIPNANGKPLEAIWVIVFSLANENKLDTEMWAILLPLFVLEQYTNPAALTTVAAIWRLNSQPEIKHCVVLLCETDHTATFPRNFAFSRWIRVIELENDKSFSSSGDSVKWGFATKNGKGYGSLAETENVVNWTICEAVTIQDRNVTVFKNAVLAIYASKSAIRTLIFHDGHMKSKRRIDFDPRNTSILTFIRNPNELYFFIPSHHYYISITFANRETVFSVVKMIKEYIGPKRPATNQTEEFARRRLLHIFNENLLTYNNGNIYQVLRPEPALENRKWHCPEIDDHDTLNGYLKLTLQFVNDERIENLKYFESPASVEEFFASNDNEIMTAIHLNLCGHLSLHHNFHLFSSPYNEPHGYQFGKAAFLGCVVEYQENLGLDSISWKLLSYTTGYALPEVPTLDCTVAGVEPVWIYLLDFRKVRTNIEIHVVPVIITFPRGYDQTEPSITSYVAVGIQYNKSSGWEVKHFFIAICEHNQNVRAGENVRWLRVADITGIRQSPPMFPEKVYWAMKVHDGWRHGGNRRLQMLPNVPAAEPRVKLLSSK